MDIGPSELILVLVVLLVLFGGSQLPKMARNLGKAQEEFKKGLSGSQQGSTDVAAAATTPTDAPSPDVPSPDASAAAAAPPAPPAATMPPPPPPVADHTDA